MGEGDSGRRVLERFGARLVSEESVVERWLTNSLSRPKLFGRMHRGAVQPSLEKERAAEETRAEALTPCYSGCSSPASGLVGQYLLSSARMAARRLARLDSRTAGCDSVGSRTWRVAFFGWLSRPVPKNEQNNPAPEG